MTLYNELVKLKTRLFVLILIAVINVLILQYIRGLTFTSAKVYNTSNKQVFIEKGMAGLNFINQKTGAKGISWFKEEMKDIILSAEGDFDLATKIRKWVRYQQGPFNPDKWKGSGGNIEDPVKLLEMQRKGHPGACRRFGYTLLGALISADLNARLVHIATDFSDNTFNHTLVEVWIDSFDKWVLIDADYDTYYLVDGKPASMIEIYETVKKDEYHRISFERNGSTFRPTPKVYNPKAAPQTPSLLIRSFKHLYIALTNAVFDGYSVKLLGNKRIDFVHYSGSGVTPYPQMEKQIAFVMFIIFTLSFLILLIFTVRKLYLNIS